MAVRLLGAADREALLRGERDRPAAPINRVAILTHDPVKGTFFPLLGDGCQSILSLNMNAYQTYRQTQTQTATPGELVLMLYRGAMRFVSRAIEAIEATDITAAHNSLVRAQDIIVELHATLDLERGGDVGRNLASIYEYLLRRLVEANLRKDAEPAREVLKLLRELLPAWEGAVRQTQAGAAASR